jgi:NAD(P)-dependent dehydrogenase (short-subunit alcohol dehydrogenase family)
MPVAPVDLENKKILITGPTGQVALPVVEHFARLADVYALARFRTEEDRALIDETVVDWRDGIRSQIEHLAADLLR